MTDEVWCEKHKHFAHHSDNSARSGLKEKACSWCGSYDQLCDVNQRKHFNEKKNIVHDPNCLNIDACGYRLNSMNRDGSGCIETEVKRQHE